MDADNINPSHFDYGERLAALEAYQETFQKDLSELKINVEKGFDRLCMEMKAQRAFLYKISLIGAFILGSCGISIGKFLL